MNSHLPDNKSAPQTPPNPQQEPDILSAQDEDIALDPKVQAAIGQSLQAYYDDLVNAPMPDKFMVLLAELSAKELKNAK